ncbi:ribonuclease J [Clostridium beijerinckii]|jgi:Predicted hydrolase of the metallo-beta-lactamase superfamily|uniref:Ribonuclease J n=2 Tax=Clostridium beijerinckii TaxID=1520 RepID=A0AAE2RSU5_CLOBE|nr:ribonuclease J [Clostridium beijerinckii]ABR34422.1 beta-lactamase domain protein [Clostridium beijerinckii NCIMB 8052]AIU01936.1 beta-lactamase domain-containing protein [Clostridium beijerinckii ATCC 35702]MBF7810958.1 ribonuclease J [Clostridium beijerinckii]NRT24257.1 ribonuclease J [Clostridium beijerinckii]NRT68154.1 ribonuclease J [Clostridium beijerinckii]
MINKSKIKSKVKIIPLGGLGEIGKNLTVFEYEDEIVIIDCGMSFPDEELLGIDLVLPDITYLLRNKDKIKGFFITHGHEDHIGGLPYVLKQINVPIYATKLTLGLIESKLEEHNILSDCTLNMVKPGDIIETGNFNIEFIRTNHSIADSVSIALHTPIGIIVHTGDFKIDFTPIDGEIIDLQRYAQLGKKGVLLLMADSTNATRSGYTMSEKTVGETLNNLFIKADGRVIVATFASSIHRVQQIANASIKNGRKIAFSGRSMEKISEVAMSLGYLFIPEEMIIDLNDVKKYPDNKVTIITTGSQGEPMAALTRIAAGNHRSIQLEKGDTVIISSTPIPGNKKAVSSVVDDLTEKGAKVIYEAIEDIHVSGHACEQELRLIQALLKPKFFVPVHGEYRHLLSHSKIAENMGINKSNIFILEIGDVLELARNKAEITNKVPAGRVLIDGLGVGDVGNIVLRDRKNLAKDGIITVVIVINRENRTLISGPDIITRGFVYVRDSEDLIREIRRIVFKSVERCLDNDVTGWSEIKDAIRKEVNTYVYTKMKRKPMVLPVITEI